MKLHFQRGFILRELIKRRWTPSRLAKAANCSKTTVDRAIEGGKVQLPAFAGICNVFGIDPVNLPE